MKRFVDQFSDTGLMCLHKVFLMALVKKTYKPEQKHIITLKERVLYNEVVNRVPVNHLWQIEKLQRDLNIKIE